MGREKRAGGEDVLSGRALAHSKSRHLGSMSRTKKKASETNSYKELKPSNPSALNLYSLAVSINLDLVYFSLKIPIMWLEVD